MPVLGIPILTISYLFNNSACIATTIRVYKTSHAFLVISKEFEACLGLVLGLHLYLKGDKRGHISPKITFGTSGDNCATPPTIKALRSNLAPAHTVEATIIFQSFSSPYARSVVASTCFSLKVVHCYLRSPLTVFKGGSRLRFHP